MVKDVYAVKLRYMIIIFVTLLNKKSTFIMVGITAVGVLGGERGVLFPLLPFFGVRERNGLSQGVQRLPYGATTGRCKVMKDLSLFNSVIVSAFLDASRAFLACSLEEYLSKYVAEEPFLSGAELTSMSPSEIVGPRKACISFLLPRSFSVCKFRVLARSESFALSRAEPRRVLALVKAGSSFSGAVCLPTTRGLNSPPGMITHSPPGIMDLPLSVSVVPSYSTLAWTPLSYIMEAICLKSLDACA